MAGASIHPFILCAVGASAGLLAGSLLGSRGTMMRVEDILVGMFGAFLGGDFLLAQFIGTPSPVPLFSMASLGLAIPGAILMLGLLRFMRGAVGPLRASRSNLKK